MKHLSKVIYSYTFEQLRWGSNSQPSASATLFQMHWTYFDIAHFEICKVHEWICDGNVF